MYLTEAVLRTTNGVVPVEIRAAVALRILVGGSYLVVAVLFGLGVRTVFTILWQVRDVINDTPAVGAFFSPSDYASGLEHAKQFKVCGKQELLSTVGGRMFL